MVLVYENATHTLFFIIFLYFKRECDLWICVVNLSYALIKFNLHSDVCPRFSLIACQMPRLKKQFLWRHLIIYTCSFWFSNLEITYATKKHTHITYVIQVITNILICICCNKRVGLGQLVWLEPHIILVYVRKPWLKKDCQSLLSHTLPLIYPTLLSWQTLNTHIILFICTLQLPLYSSFLGLGFIFLLKTSFITTVWDTAIKVYNQNKEKLSVKLLEIHI